MSPLRPLSCALPLVVLLACAPSRPADQASITCPTGKALLDGVCVSQTVADYVACVRAQGAQLGAERSNRLSADVGAAGVRAGGAYEVSDALQKHYAASDANVGEIIRTCNQLAGLKGTPAAADGAQPTADKPPKTTPQPVAGTNLPKRFRWFYMGRSEESRDWSQTSERGWQERYPDGTIGDFVVVARAEVDGDSGALLRRVPDNRQEFFIPNKGSKRMVLRMRNKTEQNDNGLGTAPWSELGEMTAIE